MLFLLLVALPLFQDLVQAAYIERNAADCELAMTRGTPGPDKGFRFFYDTELAMCFKFFYEGKNEGRNSFKTEDDCTAYCVPQDFNSCGANKTPTGFCSDMMNCADHSTCRMGSFGFGICCDKQTEEHWDKDYSPKCANGAEVVSLERWWGPAELLGKSCDHKFCPANSTCHSGKWLSYCCKTRTRANRIRVGDSRKIFSPVLPSTSVIANAEGY